MTKKLSSEELEALADLSSSAISNAIETFDVRRRDMGYMGKNIVNRVPMAKSLVGYAVTMRCSLVPPVIGKSYPDRSDWWEKMKEFPSPKIMVIEDIDEYKGKGALYGATHAAIFKALGCIGIVTDGALRDLKEMEKMGLHVFSGSVSPSHAYAHLVEVDVPVYIGGLIVRSGDLLHGDQYGVVSIPHEVAHEIPKTALSILKHKAKIQDFCTSSEFSLEKLREMVNTPASKNGS